MFSYGIEMRTGDSHSIINVTSKKRINHAASVIVGDHVWVGAHSLILKGVVILNNSVVASGSIVTKKYSISGIIIGGNPAKIIKQGINWLRNRI